MAFDYDDEDSLFLDDEELSEDILMQKVEELFSEDPDALDDFIAEYEDDYPDLAEYAFLLAVRNGNMEYVEAHINDIELNNGDDGNSEYLYETDDEEMKDLLMTYGALYPWDWYDDRKFAVETTGQTIIALDSDFQQEVYEKYKTHFDLTDAQISNIVAGKESMDTQNVAEDMKALGVSFEDSAPVFEFMYGKNGYTLMDLLETLGWECEFEGSSWKLDTVGVYFID